jgi:hypothetical protein
MSEPMDIHELFSMVLIDTRSKEQLSIVLRDADGDEVPIKEVIDNVTEYIMDKQKDEKVNSITGEIMPLMSQAMVAGLARLFGAEMAAITLSDEYMRYGFVNMMTVGFATLKFIQKKGLKIVTSRKPLTDDEISAYQRRSQASDLMTRAAVLGVNPKELMTEMLRSGSLQAEDLEAMGISKETAEQLLAQVQATEPKVETN